MLNNKLYDAFKYVALVLLPALGALYFGLSEAWGWGNGQAVLGSITVFDTFLGVFVHVNHKAYANSEDKYDGAVNVTNDGTKKTYSLEVNTDPSEIDQKDQLLLKVNSPST